MTEEQELPEWFPYLPPIYDIERPYAENAKFGPFFTEEVPKREKPPKSEWSEFLGFPVVTPIGVPAGPLLNSRWVALASQLGYDILTYKTIRSFAYGGHKLPNMIYVDRTSPDMAVQIENPSNDISELTMTNSFGMPSKSPEFLLEDIEEAQRSLKKGQVLIVSVVGSHNREDEFLDDFVNTALLAKDAGAKIIEANFSCPNVVGERIYLNPKLVHEFASKIRQAIAPVPLVIKVGMFENKKQMRDVLVESVNAGVSAVCGLNTISMKVETPEGRPALDDERITSGICGGAIRNEALHFIEQARAIIDHEKLDLVLMGCGGIMKSKHFDEFFDKGADIAMTATGMMWDPFLSFRYHRSQNKKEK